MSEDLLIQIRTALESGGIDAAKAKINELSQATQNASASGTELNATSGESARKMFGTAAAIQGATHALDGHGVSMRGITHLAHGLAGALGEVGLKLGMVAASFGIGWKIGSLIQQHLIDPLITSDQKAAAVDEALAKIKNTASALANQKMLGILDGLKDIEKAASKAAQEIDKIRKFSEEKADIQTAIKRAQIEAMPAGPAREKALADLERTSASAKLDTEEDAIRKKIALAQQSSADLDKKVQEQEARLQEIPGQAKLYPTGSAEYKKLVAESGAIVSNLPKLKAERAQGQAANIATIGDLNADLSLIPMRRELAGAQYGSRMTGISREEQATAAREAERAQAAKERAEKEAERERERADREATQARNQQASAMFGEIQLANRGGGIRGQANIETGRRLVDDIRSNVGAIAESLFEDLRRLRDETTMKHRHDPTGA
jgi:hypothetical protein